jgi:hypothetical protein
LRPATSTLLAVGGYTVKTHILPSDLGSLPQLRGLLVALGLAACGQGPLEAYGSPSSTFSIKAGRELELTLGTVGPGEYESPPAVSSAVVQFLDVRSGSPVPAGARQQFRFEAVRPGVAVIVFHHTEQGPTIEDTVEVH